MAYKVRSILYSTRTSAAGTMYSSLPTAKLDWELTRPAAERRVRPVDVSPFSLSNTPRSYFWRNERDVNDYIRRRIWNGDVYQDPVGYVSQPGPGFPGWLIADPDTVTSLLLKVKDQKASLGIALAQYRQTASMFHAACTFMSEAFSRRQKFVTRLINWSRRRRRALKGRLDPKRVGPRPVPPKGARASDVYLATTFGWMPVVQDLQGAIDVLLDRLDHPVWLGASVSRTEHAIRKAKAGNFLNLQTTEYVSQTIVKRHKMIYKIARGAVTDLRRLGVTNPADVLWDAIPYSFIVNALWPIGTWLKTLDAMVGVAEVRHYHTVKRTSSQMVELMSKRANYVHEEMFRSGVSTTVPSAVFPNYRPSKSLGLVLSGLALLDQIQSNKDAARTFHMMRV